jgi:hypothetical protein
MNVSVNKGKIELNTLEQRALTKASTMAEQIGKLAGALNDKSLAEAAREADAKVTILLMKLGFVETTEPKQKELVS